MAGKFEITKDESGLFRFRLKSRNGQVIAVGESHTRKDGAITGARAVKRAADDAEIVDLTEI